MNCTFGLVAQNILQIYHWKSYTRNVRTNNNFLSCASVRIFRSSGCFSNLLYRTVFLCRTTPRKWIYERLSLVNIMSSNWIGLKMTSIQDTFEQEKVEMKLERKIASNSQVNLNSWKPALFCQTWNWRSCKYYMVCWSLKNVGQRTRKDNYLFLVSEDQMVVSHNNWKYTLEKNCLKFSVRSNSAILVAGLNCLGIWALLCTNFSGNLQFRQVSRPWNVNIKCKLNVLNEADCMHVHMIYNHFYNICDYVHKVWKISWFVMRTIGLWIVWIVYYNWDTFLLNMGLINKVDMVCLSPVGYGV